MSSSDSEGEEIVLEQSELNFVDVESEDFIPPPPPTPPELMPQAKAKVSNTKGKVLLPWRKDPALINALLRLAITEGYHLPLKSEKGYLRLI